MTTLNCAVEGCKVQFTTDAAVSPDANFICKNHSVGAQKKAIRFQEFAFDPSLNPGGNSKSESEEYDRDWGISGEPITPGEKCAHGVYDPHEDQRYCSICNPVPVAALVREIKKTKNGRIGAFKDLNEQANQAASVVLFYFTLPEHLQPLWFTDRELALKTSAKRVLSPQLKKNKNFGRDQFGDGIE